MHAVPLLSDEGANWQWQERMMEGRGLRTELEGKVVLLPRSSLFLSLLSRTFVWVAASPLGDALSSSTLL